MFGAAFSEETIFFERFQIESESGFSKKGFRIAKRVYDVSLSILLLPMLVMVALVLLVLNPFYNRGSLGYTQTRMGRDCKPFTVFKFRSMTDAPEIRRSANGPLETNRITRLGHFMRKTRIDELPQLLNVIRGDMSLIGPRPDYYDHACEFLYDVPGYRSRHIVRPGMTGVAQTEVGYVEGAEATQKKVNADLFYISNTNWRLEAWIIWRTIVVIFGCKGV